MWKIRKFSIQSGLELMTTRMIDEVLTNSTTEAVMSQYSRTYILIPTYYIRHCKISLLAQPLITLLSYQYATVLLPFQERCRNRKSYSIYILSTPRLNSKIYMDIILDTNLSTTPNWKISQQEKLRKNIFSQLFLYILLTERSEVSNFYEIGNFWLSERSERSLRFDKIGKFFFRRMSVCLYVCQFRSRGHSF